MATDKRPRTALEDVLSDGIYDWLLPTYIFDAAHARLSGILDSRAFAIGIVAELILGGLAIPGDVVDGRHQPWASSPAESLARIASEWLACGTRVPTPGEITWLALTPAGHESLNTVIKDTFDDTE